MSKLLIELLNLLALVALASIPFLKTKGRGVVALSVVTMQTIIGSLMAVSIFVDGAAGFFYQGSLVTGPIPIRIDYLSAWFILVISFTFLTGSWYGFRYMERYADQGDNIALHAISLILVYTALVDLCVVQNGFVFLVIWEIMALGSFIIIIFEHYKVETLKAGINFLIQSHICILLLTIAFIWVKVKTGSFDFLAITQYTTAQPMFVGLILFAFFFTGFAIKSGFVPFHTWLPLAHPAAPAHVSGIMSGVIIKIGIYGILRVLTLIKTDMVFVGYFILVVSVITGVYGVMLAIVQHNLKKLLAYHSIENIGIIGIGIGLGCLGTGYGNMVLTITGFGGALLHTLNHSLFKSLLFYCAGNIYQSKHTMNIDSMGGLLKEIPLTAYLFLIASLAICGLPPFNGFVSEFLIYNGLFNGLITNETMLMLLVLFAVLGMVLIGGLALICFTKAFGIVFLGTPRNELQGLSVSEHGSGSESNHKSEPTMKTVPMILIAAFIVVIGLFPGIFGQALIKIIGLFPLKIDANSIQSFNGIMAKSTVVGGYSLGFVILALIFYLVRSRIGATKSKAEGPTWGCGYTGDTSKMQYTASSFIRSYRKLSEPILMVNRKKKEASGLYPQQLEQETHPGDKVENILIDKPLMYIRSFLGRFKFLQNGNIQTYILYGLVFIGLVILLPLVVDLVKVFINIYNLL